MQFVSFDFHVLHNTPLIDKKTTQKIYSGIHYFSKIFMTHKIIICDKLIDHKLKNKFARIFSLGINGLENIIHSFFNIV